jgi:hypothetical protein
MPAVQRDWGMPRFESRTIVYLLSGTNNALRFQGHIKLLNFRKQNSISWDTILYQTVQAMLGSLDASRAPLAFEQAFSRLGTGAL